MDLTSSFAGITTPTNELHAQIARYGWEVTKLGWDPKINAFKAEGRDQFGQTTAKTGPNDKTALANLLLAIARRTHLRTSAQYKLGMWTTMFTGQLKEIAEAYAQAPVYDPKAATYFKELADDSTRRAHVLGQQLHIEVVDNPEPYPNAQAMADDIHKNKHFLVSRANCDHPIWSVEQNVAFRIVHDVLGHCFVPGTLVRTELGYRPIENIKVGERVLSSDGKFHSVKTLWSKQYDGEIVAIDTGVGSNPIRTTPNHELLSLAGHHKRSHHKNPCSPHYCGRAKRKPEEYHSVEWQAAEALSDQSYLATNPMNENRDIRQIDVPSRYHGVRVTHRRAGSRSYELTPEFLWIIGLYLAEGSADKTKISFGLHRSEKVFQDRVIAFFEQQGYKTHYAKRPEGDNGVKIEIYGTMLAEWFSDWLGRGCQNKQIPSELTNLPVHRLRHVIDGIMDGDGWKTRDGIGQTSPILALQLVEYGLRSGLMVSTTGAERPSPYQKIYLSFGLRFAERRGANKRGFWNLHDRLFARVTNIGREQYSGTVYDLEVEGDHSYIVENIVVHNSVSGGDFGWQGENLACAAHAPLLTPTAQLALFSECIAQTAYAAYYRSFGPQKVALFPQFVEPAQAKENPAAHRGVHPSQSVAPEAMPQIPPSPPADTPHEKGYVAPHMQPQGLTPLVSRREARLAGSVLLDPNKGYETGIAPLDPTQDIHPVTGQPVGNAYLHHGDPIESDKVMDTAALIDTRWHELPERPMQKQAIVNAFRVVLLSPRKDLRWNAIHYQDIANIPSDTKDPLTYWNTLNNRRQEWNMDQVRRHYEPDVKAGKMTKEAVEHLAEQARHSHEAWRKLWPKFFAIVLQQQGDHQKAQRWAEDMIYRWTSDEQVKIELEEGKKAPDKMKNQDEIERSAQAGMVKRMTVWIEDNKPKMDSLFAKTINEDDEWYNSPPAKLYHFAPPGSEKRILREGIRPTQLSISDSSKINALGDGVYMYGYNPIAIHNPGAGELYEINGRGIEDKLTPDFDIDQAWHHPGPIDPGRIKRVAKRTADSLFDIEPEQTVGEQRPKIVRYGAFMGTHLKAISQISKHADAILDAAIQDVHEHDGTGHHFRAAVLQLNVSGVGPKVCSFAWLLLQPLTSQLATIDTHMCDVLGHKFEKDLNNRDYFRFERELQAGRDAAGYGHIPLGAFQWGMWDYKRTGAGSHQDHSAMKVLDPTPHHMIDWAKHAGPQGAGVLKAEKWHEQGPDWWKNTRPARDAVRSHWDENIAPNTPVGEIPFQIADESMTRAASSGTKNEFHVAFTLPEELFAKLDALANELGIRKEDPENYHITGFSAKDGFDRQELHRWIKDANVSGLRFTNARLEYFPSKIEKEKYAVVLRFDAPEAKELMTRLMDEGEKDYDLDITRFDGGWKGHITLGWSDKNTPRRKCPEIEFRTGPLYISIPRPLRKEQEDPLRSTRVSSKSKMHQYRMQTGLATPEIWNLYPDTEEDDSIEDPQGDSADASSVSGFESVPSTPSDTRQPA